MKRLLPWIGALLLAACAAAATADKDLDAVCKARADAKSLEAFYGIGAAGAPHDAGADSAKP